ncbi:MAG TPA: site-2 protease family protein [Candidatus Thermoplasmatota archaeon]|nr:site-2 protease family protein [Candidatus Thermoplasmatota archaeon]
MGVVLNLADLRRAVERRFPVYDVQTDENVAAFYVTVDPATLESDFDALRRDLKLEQLVPILKYQGGEHAVYVVHRPERAYRSRRVNLVLFIATWITTTLAGASAWFFYSHPGQLFGEGQGLDGLKAIYAPQTLFFGFLTFALPLMLILGIHEMGHYVLSRRHGMEASLPFFIPLPPFIQSVEIGTLGAFISMREPIPDRKALLDIGISGPIAGFVVAIPVLFIGMLLMAANPVFLPEAQVEGAAQLGTPLLYNVLALPFDFPDAQVIHPTAFAGWVGLFVTAINLLPAGQLDGGHVAAAMFGDKARYASYASVALLASLGFGLLRPLGIPQYSGWVMFALLVAFLGLQHPPTLNHVTKLDTNRKVLGWLTFGLMVLCFTPVPISG